MSEILLLEDRFADYLDHAAAHLLEALPNGFGEHRPERTASARRTPRGRATVVLPRLSGWPTAHRAPWRSGC